MVDEIRGDYGVCYIQDCLEGMRKLIEEKRHFHFIISDPPYNSKKETKTSGMNDSETPREVEMYDDNMDDEKYHNLLTEFFELGKVLSDYMIFTCGKRNLWFWQLRDPIFEDQWGMWSFNNSPSRGTFSKFLKFEPILFYGDYSKFQKEQHWDKDIFYYDIYNGFRRKGEFLDKGGLKDPNPDYILKHPHSKPFNMYRDWIVNYHPTSILEPFCGSGLVPRICEMYKIPYVAFEINPYFKSDIEWNIAVGKANVIEKKWVKKDLKSMLKYQPEFI